MEKNTEKGSQLSIDTKLGYTVETLNGIMHAITFPGETRTFRVGQKVIASGKIFVRRGTEGIIVKIDDPFDGPLRSPDIIHVLFKGFDYPHMLKSKDLI